MRGDANDPKLVLAAPCIEKFIREVANHIKGGGIIEDRLFSLINEFDQYFEPAELLWLIGNFNRRLAMCDPSESSNIRQFIFHADRTTDLLAKRADSAVDCSLLALPQGVKTACRTFRKLADSNGDEIYAKRPLRQALGELASMLIFDENPPDTGEMLGVNLIGRFNTDNDARFRIYGAIKLFGGFLCMKRTLDSTENADNIVMIVTEAVRHFSASESTPVLILNLLGFCSLAIAIHNSRAREIQNWQHLRANLIALLQKHHRHTISRCAILALDDFEGKLVRNSCLDWKVNIAVNADDFQLRKIETICQRLGI
tara:strand:- start:1025 stop:1966 length:942 start_codon:yes stop_codon:yes gene_type:complete